MLKLETIAKNLDEQIEDHRNTRALLETKIALLERDVQEVNDKIESLKKAKELVLSDSWTKPTEEPIDLSGDAPVLKDSDVVAFEYDSGFTQS